MFNTTDIRSYELTNDSSSQTNTSGIRSYELTNDSSSQTNTTASMSVPYLSKKRRTVPANKIRRT